MILNRKHHVPRFVSEEILKIGNSMYLNIFNLITKLENSCVCSKVPAEASYRRNLSYPRRSTVYAAL